MGKSKDVQKLASFLDAVGVGDVDLPWSDNILPALASKKSGAGKPGVWGSVLGMIAGSFFFPPFGTIIGAFLGALLRELLFNRSNERPLKAALGVFKGTMLGILLKITTTGVTTFFYVRGVGRLFSA